MARVVLATTYFVATNGSDLAGGTAWNVAVRTISNGLARATQTGDVVVVSNGAYLVTTQLLVLRSVVLTGFLGKAQTIVDANGPVTSNRCLYIDHTNALVTGFTFSNGYVTASDGGGVYVLNGTMSDCMVSGNRGVNGAGVTAWTGSRILACVITGNVSSAAGAGVYLVHAFVSNCTIVNNTASGAGGGAYARGTNALLTHCDTIARNRGNAGGGVYIYTNGTLDTCLVRYNVATNGAGAIIWEGGLLQYLFHAHARRLW